MNNNESGSSENHGMNHQHNFTNDRKREIKEQIRKRYRGIDSNLLSVIPATPKVSLMEDTSEKSVCAYCRVSTDDPKQTSSYELQKNHYEEEINSHPGWKLYGVYADEGISGTSLNHRDAFVKMIQDCEEHLVDLIITKSVSRFARNLLDCIATVRKLQALRPPVGVFFEAEHISTLDNGSEMLLGVLSMAAQEESRTKSEIMNISIEQRFSKGIFLTPGLLGYDRDEEGNLVINQEEAKTVTLMYFMLLTGSTAQEIAGMLMELQRPTKLGRHHWSRSTVAGILRNERYCGEVLARKSFTPNYLDHKSRPNKHRERTQYRQPNHHEAIISPEDWRAAQKILDSFKYGHEGGFTPLRVIDSGALKGFVTVNRGWAGSTFEDYYKASSAAYGLVEQAMPESSAQETTDDDSEEMRKATAGGFQVVSQNLFCAMYAPAVSLCRGHISFNGACVQRLKQTKWVEILLNPVERLLAVRPCDENCPNAVRWIDTKGNFRVLGAKGFCIMLFDMLDWDDECRYRLRALSREKDGDTILFFDLDTPLIYARNASWATDSAEANAGNGSILCFGSSFAEHITSTRLPWIDVEGQWDVRKEGKAVERTSGVSSRDVLELKSTLENEMLRDSHLNEGKTDGACEPGMDAQQTNE